MKQEHLVQVGTPCPEDDHISHHKHQRVIKEAFGKVRVEWRVHLLVWRLFDEVALMLVESVSQEVKLEQLPDSDQLVTS